MAQTTTVAVEATPLPSSAVLERVAAFTREPFRLPRFSKASDDRLPVQEWPLVRGPRPIAAVARQR